jgi:hypothetical protein
MTKKIITLGLGIFLCLGIASGQEKLWPGDVNNNGIVNNIDLLYMADAFFKTGPPRSPSEMGDDWSEKDVDALWPTSFLNGPNHAYADCNGDGIVIFEESTIEQNYGLTHGSLIPDTFAQGIAGTNPAIFMDGIMDSLFFEGGAATIRINLGTPSMPVSGIRSIAYTLKYDPNIFDPGIANVLPGQFFSAGAEDVIQVTNIDPVAGTIDVAMARVGTSPATTISGSGDIGLFFIVIEDDVVGLTGDPVETTIYIEKVKAFGEDMNEMVIYADSAVISIIDDQMVNNTSSIQNETSILVYPQPTSDYLKIETPHQNIHAIELTNLAGQVVLSEQFSIAQQTPINVNTVHLPNGLYLLKTLTNKGWLSTKVVIAP